MQKARGFTLIELMVVMAIAAILMSLAAPAFKRTIQSNAMSSAVNTFLSDTRFARSESVRLGGSVIMCRADTPEDSAPTCGTNAGPGGNGWVTGWIIFQDRDGSGNYNVGDTLLRVQAALPAPDSILEGVASTSTPLKFTGTGRLLSSTGTATLHFGGSNYPTAVQRVVCVGLGGRARIAGDGSTSCGSTNE